MVLRAAVVFCPRLPAPFPGDLRELLYVPRNLPVGISKILREAVDYPAHTSGSLLNQDILGTLSHLISDPTDSHLILSLGTQSHSYLS